MRYSYLVFKHVIYFGFNYRCFLASTKGGSSPSLYAEQRDSWPVVLAFVGGLNWLFFQHTLVLRKILSPLVAESPLVVIIVLVLCYLPRMFSFLFDDLRVVALSACGLACNIAPYYVKLLPRKLVHAHYALTMLLLLYARQRAEDEVAAHR